jgi:nucleotide-binding universal stress UspA family protein
MLCAKCKACVPASPLAASGPRSSREAQWLGSCSECEHAASRARENSNVTVVCGTDFSLNAEHASWAAGAIAKRLGVALKLVHVLPDSALLSTLLPGEATLQAALDAQAVVLRERIGIDVDAVAVYGVAAHALVEFSRGAAAQLIVVAALGSHTQPHWLVGSVAERVAQRSPIPVLVVRDASSIQAWANGESALRVTVGVDLGASSMVALRWVEGLRGLLPCDVCVAQVAWPVAEFARLGIRGPIELEGLRSEVQSVLQTELRSWAGELQGMGQTRYLVSPGWGRVDDHLAQLAQELGTDLLVVGTHQRAWAARVWQGSISRGAIHYAASNVACIPVVASQHDESLALDTSSLRVASA